MSRVYLCSYAWFPCTVPGVLGGFCMRGHVHFAFPRAGIRRIVSSVQIREAVLDLLAHVGVVVLFRAAFGIPNRRSQPEAGRPRAREQQVGDFHPLSPVSTRSRTTNPRDRAPSLSRPGHALRTHPGGELQQRETPKSKFRRMRPQRLARGRTVVKVALVVHVVAAAVFAFSGGGAAAGRRARHRA